MEIEIDKSMNIAEQYVIFYSHLIRLCIVRLYMQYTLHTRHKSFLDRRIDILQS